MELVQLQYFVAAAKVGNLTKAANNLNITQSALSKAILKLEQELGTDLFSRTHKHLELNGAGRAFLEYAERVLAELTEGISVVKRTNIQTENRTFSVAATFPNLLSGLAEAYYQEHPNGRMNVYLSDFESALNKVVSLEYDCSFVLDPSIPDNRLHWNPMLQEAIIGVTGPRLKAWAGQVTSLAELKDVPLLLTDSGFEYHNCFLAICQAAGFSPNIVYRSTEFSDLNKLLSAGDCVLMLPLGEARRAFRDADLCSYGFLVPSPQLCFREIGLVHRKDGYDSVQIHRFLDFCRKYFHQYQLENTQFLQSIRSK
jgi:DNA-binding transcriptional LysR family regulator